MHDRARCGGWVVCVGKKEIHCQMLNKNLMIAVFYTTCDTLQWAVEVD